MLRGIFNRQDLNVVQEKILITVESRRRKQEYELETARFEQNMLINNSEMYQRYMDNKKEEEEAGGPIVWSTPNSIEEAHELEKMFVEAVAKTKKIIAEEETEAEKEANEEFYRQVKLMSNFQDINLDQIGGE